MCLLCIRDNVWYTSCDYMTFITSFISGITLILSNSFIEKAGDKSPPECYIFPYCQSPTLNFFPLFSSHFLKSLELCAFAFCHFDSFITKTNNIEWLRLVSDVDVNVDSIAQHPLWTGQDSLSYIWKTWQVSILKLSGCSSSSSSNLPIIAGVQPLLITQKYGSTSNKLQEKVSQRFST